MVRKLFSATVSAALCMAACAPAMAQDYRFSGFDAPRGAAATVNLRVRFGPEQARRPSYGLTLGYGHIVGADDDAGATTSRAVTLADFRFSGGELSQARLVSFDLANLDDDPRLNLTGGGKKTWLLLGGIVVAGVAICLAADCFDDDEEDMPNTSTPGQG